MGKGGGEGSWEEEGGSMRGHTHLGRPQLRGLYLGPLKELAPWSIAERGAFRTVRHLPKEE